MLIVSRFDNCKTDFRLFWRSCQ